MLIFFVGIVLLLDLTISVDGIYEEKLRSDPNYAQEFIQVRDAKLHGVISFNFLQQAPIHSKQVHQDCRSLMNEAADGIEFVRWSISTFRLLGFSRISILLNPRQYQQCLNSSVSLFDDRSVNIISSSSDADIFL